MRAVLVDRYPAAAVGRDGHSIAASQKGGSWVVACESTRVEEMVLGAFPGATRLTSDQAIEMRVGELPEPAFRQALATIADEVEDWRHAVGHVDYALHGAD